MKKFILTLFSALCLLGQARERPVASAWMAEFGSSHIADTYLSPLRYDGLHYSLTFSRLQAMMNPSLVQGWDVSVAFDNAKMLAATFDGSWRIMRRWLIPNSIQLGVGGYAGIQVGALYYGRNSNNPAQAIAAINIGPEAFAQWSSKIRRMPIALRYQASTPIIGTFFCPEYGELYYEIALGNHKGLSHIAWPYNFRRIRSLLSADLTFGKYTLRLGYRLDAFSSRANNISSRRISHAAVVGIVFNSINLKIGSNDASFIPAL